MGWFQNALLNIPRAQTSSTRLCAGRSPPTSRIEQPTKFDLMVNLNRRQGARSHRAADATRRRQPYVKRQKNDMADAEAICEAVARANMRFVPTKTPEQQSCLMLHRTRHLFIR